MDNINWKIDIVLKTMFMKIMNDKKLTTYYNKRTWLNAEDSPSTGNVCCFDGLYHEEKEDYRHIFLSVSDCHVSARLHKTGSDTVEDFINKMKKLRTELDLFINHLENTPKND